MFGRCSYCFWHVQAFKHHFGNTRFWLVNHTAFESEICMKYLLDCNLTCLQANQADLFFDYWNNNDSFFGWTETPRHIYAHFYFKVNSTSVPYFKYCKTVVSFFYTSKLIKTYKLWFSVCVSRWFLAGINYKTVQASCHGSKVWLHNREANK